LRHASRAMNMGKSQMQDRGALACSARCGYWSADLRRDACQDHVARDGLSPERRRNFVERQRRVKDPALLVEEDGLPSRGGRNTPDRRAVRLLRKGLDVQYHVEDGDG